jgi:hypothetical protein
MGRNWPMSALAEAFRAASTRRMVIGAIGAFILLLLAAAVVLWVKLGTAVFFDVIRAGIAYCF